MQHVVNHAWVSATLTLAFLVSSHVSAQANPCRGKQVGSACPDDGKECTDDVCARNAQGGLFCDHPNRPTGAPCGDDGKECTRDVCQTGVCAHPPKAKGIPCGDEGNECTKDECNGAGACAHPAKVDGTSCGAAIGPDKNICRADSCVAGACTPKCFPDNTPCGANKVCLNFGGNNCFCKPLPTGGCSFPDGACVSGLTDSECIEAGGIFLGEGSECPPLACEATPIEPGSGCDGIDNDCDGTADDCREDTTEPFLRCALVQVGDEAVDGDDFRGDDTWFEVSFHSVDDCSHPTAAEAVIVCREELFAVQDGQLLDLDADEHCMLHVRATDSCGNQADCTAASSLPPESCECSPGAPDGDG